MNNQFEQISSSDDEIISNNDYIEGLNNNSTKNYVEKIPEISSAKDKRMFL